MVTDAFVLFFSKRLLNLIIVLCVVSPALVSYWRGTWFILDLFVFPDRPLLGAWLTFSLSFGTIHAILLTGNYLKAILNERKFKKLSYLALFYPVGFLIVNTWRGLWILWDHYTTTSLMSGLLSHALGFYIVLLTQTTSSITAAPSYCITEAKEDQLQTVFQGKPWLKSSNASTFSRIVDSFLTVFVTGAAVISYWRGTWVIMDALSLSFKVDKSKSWTISVCIGYTLFTICYFVSELVENAKNLSPPFSLRCRALEQMYVYILGFATVNCWRGIWHMEDIYLLPDQFIASALVSHFGGIAVLYLLQTSLILVCSPAGCRFHGSEMLEGFNLGSFLQKNTDSKDENRKTSEGPRS